MQVSNALESNDRNLGQAFLKVLRTEHTYLLEPNVVSDAYLGFQRLKAGLDKVEKTIKEWSHVNGPFQAGTTLYGWKEQESRKLDVAFLLKTMGEAGIPLETQAKALNASASSISRLPKEFNDIKDLILSIGVDKTSKKKVWGVVDDRINEIGDPESVSCD